MRGLPFFKAKNKPQFAGLNFSDYSSSGGGGSGDTSALVNKTDLTAIILMGTINTSGSTITSGTWFYLNGKPCIAKVDIASGATFTEGTNYEEKTIGSALTELNSNITLGTLGCKYKPTNESVPSGTYLSAWLTSGEYTFIYTGDRANFTDLPTSDFAGVVYDIRTAENYHLQIGFKMTNVIPIMYIRYLVNTTGYTWKQLQYVS